METELQALPNGGGGERSAHTKPRTPNELSRKEEGAPARSSRGRARQLSAAPLPSFSPITKLSRQSRGRAALSRLFLLLPPPSSLFLSFFLSFFFSPLPINNGADLIPDIPAASLWVNYCHFWVDPTPEKIIIIIILITSLHL